MNARPDPTRDGRAAGFVRLGRYAGIPVRAHFSLLAILAVVGGVLALGVLPGALPGRPSGAYWLVGAGAAVVFLAAVLAHELAHAMTARRYGLHVEHVTLWLLGGATVLRSEPRTPRADAVIALSGPVTSLLLGGVFAALAWLSGGAAMLTAALGWLAGVNVLLGVFNLLPGAPLDGGRVLRAVLWKRYRDRTRAAQASARAGSILGTAFVVLGLVQVLMGALLGLWLALIGWFMIGAAATERQAAAAKRLAGRQARQLMRTPPATAPDWWTVADFLGHLGDLQPRQRVFALVDFEGTPRRLLSLAELARVRPDARDTTRLRDAVRNPVPPLIIDAETPLPELVPRIRGHGGIAVVTDQDQVIGTVHEDDLLTAVALANLDDQSADPPDGEGAEDAIAFARCRAN